MRKSLFVTFEGGEGAGKTTLIRRLEKELNQRHYSTLQTREPGGTPLGEQIRLLVLRGGVKVDARAELLLFLAARAQHLQEVIRPALAEGKTVLCDRFNDSSVAYQGIARGLGEEYVQQLCDQVCQGTTPDLTFFLDLDPSIGMERALKEQRVMDRLENEGSSFHDKVRQGFFKLHQKNSDRIKIIDASDSPEAVFNQAWQEIENKFRATHV